MKPETIAYEIREELRSILRSREDLRQPLSKFEQAGRREEGRPAHYVAFDMNPRRPIRGLRINVKKLSLPDERILDEVHHFAKSVWHLKDRLKQWINSRNLRLRPEQVAEQSKRLKVVADLANKKKHGKLKHPRTDQNPRLGVPVVSADGERVPGGDGLVSFDTSKSGLLEFWYNGASKEKELMVTNTSPIPFEVEILVGDGTESLGNAVDFIYSAFCEWIPILLECGVLEGEDEESKILKRRLFAD